MDIKLSKKMSSDVYKFHQITEDMPPKSIATRVDPLEKNQIYVGPSEMEGMSFGEGVFAKRSIPGNFKFTENFFTFEILQPILLISKY